MVNNKRKFPIFVITLIIGLGIIGFALFEADFDVGTLTSLSILEVPIDPFTGGILGTIVLGAPDEIPFEQAGTVFGIPATSRAFPRSPCTDNFLATDGLSVTKDRTMILVDTETNRVFLQPPDFERRLSGERNQNNPVWWGSLESGIFPNVSFSCAFAYAQFDIVDIPNDFKATSVVLKLKVLETRSARNPTFQVAPQGCDITLQDFNLDTIADEGIMNKVYDSRSRFATNLSLPPSDALLIKTGSWCNSLGVKTFQLGQGAVDLINDAISGGAFSQGVRSDKLLLGFTPTHLNNEGSGKNRISTLFWKTEGSFFITGSSPPIKCNIGFNQVDFRCVAIVCATDEKLNQSTNQCELIQCPSGENLEIIQDQILCPAVCIDDGMGGCVPCPFRTVERAICTPIQCQIGESLQNGICQRIVCLDGTTLVGSTCDPVFCNEGFVLAGDICMVKTCGTGLELIGDTCQPIVCPTNTIISGNNCIEIQCPSGQISSNNECVPDTIQILCVEGFKRVGDECVPILDCPSGTVTFENNCRQIVPDILMISGINPSMFLIIGFVIAGISTVGIAVRRR